jgi:hypothetical protein
MSFRPPFCREVDLTWASLWAGPVIFDVTSLMQALGGLVLGLARVRVLPAILIAVGWEAAELLVHSCTRLTLEHWLPAMLRPAPSDVLFTLAGWMVGRTCRWLDRRRREARLLAEAQAEADDAWQNVVATALSSPADRWMEGTDGSPAQGTQLELDEEETAVLRAAVDARLADLRRESQNPARPGFSAELWERIGVLESLLARLPRRTSAWRTAS